MIHSKLDTLEIVFWHLRIHLAEMSGSFPTAGLDAQHRQTGVEPACKDSTPAHQG